MPSTPFDATHPDNLRAMIGALLPEAGTQHITEAGDGKAEAMLRAITETGLARATGEDVTGETAGANPSPVRVVPAGMWRPKAIAAALRQEGEAPPKEIEAITAFMLGFHTWRELVGAAIAVDVLQPTAKAGRPAPDPDTVARMRAAVREHVDAYGGDDLDSEGDDDLDD